MKAWILHLSLVKLLLDQSQLIKKKKKKKKEGGSLYWDSPNCPSFGEFISEI
jgi:hypothetical protein